MPANQHLSLIIEDGNTEVLTCIGGWGGGEGLVEEKLPSNEQSFLEWSPCLALALAFRIHARGLE